MPKRVTSKQIRSLPLQLSTRSEGTEEQSEDQNMIVSGYFAVFNQETELFPAVFETIAPTAFDDIGDDVRALVDHDTSKPLGRTKAGTLVLNVDETGLYGSITINPNDTEAVNLYERVKRGDVDQCSFGFSIEKEESEYREDGSVSFTVEKVKLYEVSVVTFPAYEATNAFVERKAQVQEMEAARLDVRKKLLKERMKKWL